ncbi:hypothetical protein GF371_04790 [Candidatus Woesearchaeota archaeon]|nr:hypothetical protein [Candidatus Woesearchaeota archaeon]
MVLGGNVSAIDPTAEIKTRLEVSLEEVFSVLDIAFFRRVYHGQSSKRRKAKEKKPDNLPFLERFSFYLSDHSKIEIKDNDENVRLLSADPSLAPLIRRNSLLYKGFSFVYMILCDKATPHIKDKNRLAFANNVIRTRSYDAEKLFVDYNHSEDDGTLIERMTVATFTLDSNGTLQHCPVGKKRKRRVPKEVREKLPQLELFLCYEPGLFDYSRFKSDLAEFISGR